MNETSQNQVLEVCKWVQDFRKQGRYEQAQAYISSADPKTKRIPVVAIEIASLYLVQGHYIRAWQSCELPEFDIFLNGEPSAPLTHRIYDVDCVALALIKAYIGILRFSRLFTALKIAERVHDVWLVENRE